MSNLMRIGELAQQTGLSIRTLHYYDEINLLSPQHRTSAGHRLYGEAEIARLQQILSLRQLGFSLDEIRECLESPEFSLPKVIDLHRHRLREQMALSRTLLDRLNGIATELETSQSVAVERLIQTMETISMTQQYFTPEQEKVVEARFREEEGKWQDLLDRARSEMEKGSDLTSLSARRLARSWRQAMKSLICGDAQIYKSLIGMYQQAGPEAASWGTLDTATFEYILKAVSFLSLAEEMDMVIPTAQIFTPQTQEVIQLGQDTLRQLDIGVFGTEGLLLGLLVQGKSIAARVLVEAGANLEAAKEAIVQILASHPTPPVDPSSDRLPYAPRTKRVIELALDRAERGDRTGIVPEDLLLAILDEAAEGGGGVATHILQEEFGINLPNLQQQLRSARSQ
ncbi:MerR family transcriptional regulator [Oscillatoriales cyanobacterium LEGE 11467]|uniref:MerR family transcriptional regulator n=1 Tax=Zarconia navalis LEGE 11467 TaxID=1828826 RepID=A0A928W1F7_9CYAN|nr:MerR family transcriptional regulator [Zarconia navalis LEGE 11467]